MAVGGYLMFTTPGEAPRVSAQVTNDSTALTFSGRLLVREAAEVHALVRRRCYAFRWGGVAGKPIAVRTAWNSEVQTLARSRTISECEVASVACADTVDHHEDGLAVARHDVPVLAPMQPELA